MFKIIALILFLMPVAGAFADHSVPDIRYRTIVYFYPDAQKIDVSSLKRAFNGFALVESLPKNATKPVFSYSVINDVAKNYPVPDLDYLAYFGRGLDKQQADKIQQSNLAVIIDVAYPQQNMLNGLKSSSVSVFEFASNTHGLIWDSETRELFTPAAWKERRIDSWQDSWVHVQRHTVIHAYQSDKGVRAITLGMAKFGLPDIVVNDFVWSQNRSMGNLITLVAQSLVEGVPLSQDGYLELNISRLTDSEYKQELLATLIDNADPKVNIQVGEANWEEGDPDNYLIELLFNHADGTSVSEKQAALLSSLFGSEDIISHVKHNQEIEAASQRAKKQLNSLREAFNAGLKPGEFIQVKAPFAQPDGGNEWMWVEVLSWQGNEIKGLLKNEPYNIPDLKGGSEVVVNQQEIFDFIRLYPDGTSQGNETGALIMKYQQ